MDEVEDFGDWPLGVNIRRLLYRVLDDDHAVLELGSGVATEEMAKHYRMISIEDDTDFLDQYNSHYIYAPIRNGWYDPIVIRDGLLGQEYDGIIIDGPSGVENRKGFNDFAYLFDLSGWIFVDDVNRDSDLQVFEAIRRIVGLKRVAKYFCDMYDKAFGVICPIGLYTGFGDMCAKMGLEPYNPYKGVKK